MLGLGSEFSAATKARAQRVGYPTTLIWGYDFIGIDPATGRELYNVNGNTVDGIYLKDHYNEEIYWEPIGNSQPDLYGGWNNRFKVGRNFDVAVLLTYSFGADIKIQKDFLDNYRGIDFKNMTINTYYGSWKHPGDIAVYPAITDSNPIISNSSKYVFSNSHIKLKSVNFSYKVPINNTTLPFDVLRFYTNASNLFYWFMEKTPEGQNGVAELRKRYPEMRTFSVGINANF